MKGLVPTLGPARPICGITLIATENSLSQSDRQRAVQRPDAYAGFDEVPMTFL
jgi:hypothetical protein